jgi:hypothetical protein
VERCAPEGTGAVVAELAELTQPVVSCVPVVSNEPGAAVVHHHGQVLPDEPRTAPALLLLHGVAQVPDLD